jgi:outer membrane protein assembly factor BamB
MRALPICLALAACSDFNLQGLGGDAGKDPDKDTGFDPEEEELGACDPEEFPAESVPLSDTCHHEIGGFEPTVVWEVEGNACSQPAVGDIDGNGMPDVVVTMGWLFEAQGELVAYTGEGGLLWETRGAKIAYGSGPTLADLDGDGEAEILAVRLHTYNLMSDSVVSVVMFDADGNEIAESEQYSDGEFDQVTGIAVADMDHDGHAEIVAGRVILNDDLTERGVGRSGRGCDNYFGVGPLYGEGAMPVIADMDLDGVDEVVVGNAFYDPDGREIMKTHGDDGAVVIANLDGDPEGEFIRATYSTLTAHDTDGSEIWSFELPGGGGDTPGIMSNASVADIDGDGLPEVVAARANNLWALNAEDGSVLWKAGIHDSTGATGASMFDFEGDGVQEVVYIDEVALYGFDGTNGTLKFKSDAHHSDTLYDYPTIADVDADGHADIVVTHDGNFSGGPGFSVYRDKKNSWAPARSVWNQHAYSITNVNDDLTIPRTATPNFTLYNNFHSAQALPPGEALGAEMEAEILSSCADDCDRGWFLVTARIRNTGTSIVAAGTWMALYAEDGDGRTLLDAQQTTAATASGMTSEAFVFAVNAEDIEGAKKLVAVADDNGSGTGTVSECEEVNNEAILKQPFCE